VSEVLELSEPGYLVVASDGLWDVISFAGAADVLRAAEQQTAAHLASKLLKQAVASAKCNDNVTVIVAML
jgi:serine/threonine protein phosphatase PrpC